MPTVAATYEYTVEKINKSGKHVTTGQTVIAANIVARELDNGSLLIQFNEPDGAMTLPAGTRLRIAVGDWIADTAVGNTAEMTFIFADVPLHTGSVVIPAEQYTWIKDKMEMKDGILEIGGMYRQQFNGYHNRGFIEGIKFPIQ
jgi:hypothetical protein